MALVKPVIFLRWKMIIGVNLCHSGLSYVSVERVTVITQCEVSNRPKRWPVWAAAGEGIGVLCLMDLFLNHKHCSPTQVILITLTDWNSGWSWWSVLLWITRCHQTLWAKTGCVWKSHSPFSSLKILLVFYPSASHPLLIRMIDFNDLACPICGLSATPMDITPIRSSLILKNRCDSLSDLLFHACITA